MAFMTDFASLFLFGYPASETSTTPACSERRCQPDPLRAAPPAARPPIFVALRTNGAGTVPFRCCLLLFDAVVVAVVVVLEFTDLFGVFVVVVVVLEEEEEVVVVVVEVDNIVVDDDDDGCGFSSRSTAPAE